MPPQRNERFMRTVLIANPKGGCGKSTMAVHLASWFASADEVVCLVTWTAAAVKPRQWLALLPGVAAHDTALWKCPEG